MTDEISAWLAKAKEGDQDSMTKLVEHFWEIARDMALRELAKYPAGVRQFASASDIANEALKSALSYVGEADSEVANANQFNKLLRTVISFAVIDKARQASREVEHRVGMGDDVKGRELSPDEEAMFREHAERITKSLGSEPDPVKRMVGMLGVLKQLTAREIQLALAIAFPGEPPPAISTIHVWLRDIRDRLAQIFGLGTGDE
jgi:hypothetical protein